MTEEQTAAYQALYKWAERISKWEYARESKAYQKKHKNKPLSTIHPHPVAVELCNTMAELCQERIAPEEAMAKLWEPGVRATINYCIEAGF